MEHSTLIAMAMPYLNLAVQDTVKSIKVMEQCLETVHEITNLVKKSPNRDAIFKHIIRMKSQVMPFLEFVCYA